MALAVPSEMTESPFPIDYPATFSLDRQSVQVPNPNKQRGESDIYVNAAFPNLPNSASSLAARDSGLTIDVVHSSPLFPKASKNWGSRGNVELTFGVSLARCRRHTRSSSSVDACRRTSHALDVANGTLPLATGPNPYVVGQMSMSCSELTRACDKKYTWETYEQVAGHRDNVASALLEMQKLGKVTPNETNWSVGVWCHNRPGESLSVQVTFERLRRFKNGNGSRLLALRCPSSSCRCTTRSGRTLSSTASTTPTRRSSLPRPSTYQRYSSCTSSAQACRFWSALTAGTTSKRRRRSLRPRRATS